ncbi:hypothetical protein J6590_049488 [Homalodisca vitripennis]|nr:hypothetical protein J6590_049488 [Homalodisca vitripennis]
MSALPPHFLPLREQYRSPSPFSAAPKVFEVEWRNSNTMQTETSDPTLGLTRGEAEFTPCDVIHSGTSESFAVTSYNY